MEVEEANSDEDDAKVRDVMAGAELLEQAQASKAVGADGAAAADTSEILEDGFHSFDQEDDEKDKTNK